MCGIVGYIGSKNAQDYLLSGLKRLEYRGYDSAGIVTLNGRPSLLRAKGKVAKLSEMIASHKTSDKVGIGHTRWATHGEPSEANAHPHRAGDIYLVHNGIIENYKQLKQELTEHQFDSQTDSEVLAALINSFYNNKTKLEDAVTQALQLVDGTYGIAVVSDREQDKVVVARQGSPLLIGVGDDETLIASDASALIGHTSEAIYLNDGELAVCTADSVELRDLASQPLSAKVEKIEVDMQAIQKQGYDHFLLKEIMEQPQTLANTLKGRVKADQHHAQLGGLNMTDDELREVRHVVIIGCGTALYAGQLAAYYLERLVDDVTIEVQIASEYRYRSFNLPENSVALVVSQSGETADTLACLREIKNRGARVLGVINAVGSTIAREVDGGVYVHAGPEISVASTKAFTSQVAAMTIFGLQLARAKGASLMELDKYIDELEALPGEIKALLEKITPEVEQAANKFTDYNDALYIGRDTLFPVALEGALKLKEISYIHAEGYAMGELKHGPIALVDDSFFEVALIQDNWLFDKSISGVQEVNARGGHILVVTNSTEPIEAEMVIRLDSKLDVLLPMLFNVVLQLFAYYVAVSRGTDVDQPRNLAKSVTVE
ncbi:glutamine--fructose-6-phosphate transaminase (isomerizing) [Candidatus Saccharibacteria bacterium]|jgi:glucosamine--fructose-6-phosphate aminotransferase (isomerizing)|nr:glutamine--fructose-6-phosphate transaminase (isomerizing) [Candidatus Saccharibacteria bacterium]